MLSRVVLPILIAGGLIWVFATPAQAQVVAGGCACPVGYTPLGHAACIGPGAVVVPAICPGRNIGSVAASQLQQSFWGVEQILTARRDQLVACRFFRTFDQATAWVCGTCG
jgi:hypothetical protein